MVNIPWTVSLRDPAIGQCAFVRGAGGKLANGSPPGQGAAYRRARPGRNVWFVNRLWVVPLCDTAGPQRMR
jgi:hypothetical protein